jgi:hypothetical protein
MTPALRPSPRPTHPAIPRLMLIAAQPDTLPALPPALALGFAGSPLRTPGTGDFDNGDRRSVRGIADLSKGIADPTKGICVRTLPWRLGGPHPGIVEPSRPAVAADSDDPTAERTIGPW